MKEQFNNKIIQWTTYLLLGISILSLCVTIYIPSLDGPQHLHTINVLAEIIKGNDFIKTYYQVNPTIVGYWSSHFIIVLFRLIFPAWLAEKAYMIVYVIGMFVSFRFLMKQLSPKKLSVASLLIFPFMYSTYQLLGYHTFSFAAIFYFVGIGLLIKFIKAYNLKTLILFLFATLGVFLSHALVFVFYLISVAVIYLGVIIRKDSNFKNWIIGGLKIFLAVLPSIIFWFIYISSVMDLDDTINPTSLAFIDQLKEFIRIRLLVGFSHNFESYGYRVLFLVIAVFSILAAIKLIKEIRKSTKTRLGILFSVENIFLLVSIIFLALYFFAPVRFSAGNLTNRYGLYFFYNLIIWLSTKQFNYKINIGATILIVAVFAFTRNFHVRCYRDYDKRIAEIQEVEKQIEPNSLVYHSMIQKDWMDKHFPLYIGVDKPMVNFRNPQCWGHFPVIWKSENVPDVMLGDRNILPRKNRIKLDKPEIKRIAYYIIYNTQAIENSNEYDDLKALLEKDYTKCYTSSKGLVDLYKLNQ